MQKQNEQQAALLSTLISEFRFSNERIKKVESTLESMCCSAEERINERVLRDEGVSGDLNCDSQNLMVALLKQMTLSQENVQFAQVSALIGNLQGTENRSKILTFFEQLETMATNWTSSRRANLVACHLEGQARNIFDGLVNEERTDYSRIKNAILNNKLIFSSLRVINQNKFLSSLQPRKEENLLDYGLRVLQATRDGMLPDTPEAVIEDMATGHFLLHV